ncbi:hypothetical protein PAXRUDRAFT_135910 [Paxillus rubicundulus Ve08.2h10]|uniref:WD40 repeat-like protein n=1 Tax=Paxillus rubicundulus Ve08.2h10 TaxID=930991 RepID=A0A0D0DHE5_9AGAM|nr:hypothetical protein PAXRUDRAFT_135910 [Paxillus rubicundulus Ve08.2h10]
MSSTSRNSADVTTDPLATISGHEHDINKIAYLPGGNRVVSCSDDKTVRIWDMDNGEQEGMSMEHEGMVQGLAVMRDGKKVLSGGDDNIIRVWDVETHQSIEEWDSHTGGILSIALSPDDRLAASGDLQGKIVIREMEESGPKHSIETGSSVLSVCFSPNGKKLACALNEHKEDGGFYVIQVYDVESGKLTLGPIKGHARLIRCVLWSLDGAQLFSASDDRTVRCWHSETGEPFANWSTAASHTHGVVSLALSPDGSTLVSASSDTTVRFWDAHSGDPIGQPLKHESSIWAVAVSPSGQFVASGGHDKKVSMWRVPRQDKSKKQVIVAFYLPTPLIHCPVTAAGKYCIRLPEKPFGSPTSPPATRIQRFWRGVVFPRRSSPAHVIDLQPIQGRRFWKPFVRTQQSRIATNRGPMPDLRGRWEREETRHHNSPQTQKPQALIDSSAAEAGSSTSNVVPAGRVSSFAQSNTSLDDSLIDMAGCKCMDSFGYRTPHNREGFRPWKKSPAVMEDKEQAKNAKRESASPPANADRQRIMQLEEQLEQIRREYEDMIVEKQKGEAERIVEKQKREAERIVEKQKREAEMDGLKRNLEELLCRGHGPGKPKEPHVSTATGHPLHTHCTPAVTGEAGVGGGGLVENVEELQCRDHESHEPLEFHLTTGMEHPPHPSYSNCE